MAEWELRLGDCREVMAELEPWSVDAIVTDPPYGIGFMGHEWDQPGFEGRRNGEPGLDERVGVRRQRQPSASSGAGHARERQLLGGPTGRDNRTHTLRGGAMHAGRYDLSPPAMRLFQEWVTAWAAAALRVLKPGAHLVTSGGPRTFHRLASGLEDAGFEIRDVVCWLFGQGFPKSKNLGDGWGTALKPAFEPIVVARAPLARSSLTANHAAFGTGGLNIDGARLAWAGPEDESETKGKNRHGDFASGPRTNRIFGSDARDRGAHGNYDAAGRWPPNVALDEVASSMLDEQVGEGSAGDTGAFDHGKGTEGDRIEYPPGGASRFFYCAKADRAERDVGLADFDERPLLWSSGTLNPGSFQSEGTKHSARNNHPTVKPIALMRWLCRLVTPAGGLVLDPFAGSGTTGIAALAEGFRFLGIEREAEYVEIARARIGAGAPMGAVAHG